MTQLVNQPTAAPSRKMSAVIVAGAVTSVINVLMMRYVPDFTTPEVQVLVQTGIMWLAGYMVRDHA
jgi:hypothetical protein